MYLDLGVVGELRSLETCNDIIFSLVVRLDQSKVSFIKLLRGDSLKYRSRSTKS
jgi:hypothetical protein